MNKDDVAGLVELKKLQKDAGIPHLPTQLTYQLRRAVAGYGTLAYQWADKPHRLVYDACREIEAQADTIEALQARVDVLEAENARIRRQGQDEGFAAAVQELRDMSARKPLPTLWHAASVLADSLEQSRIPCQALESQP